MPQLDFTTFASQIFWLITSFGVLYFLMARFALPVVRDVLQTREERIASDLKKAAHLKEEAESAQADFTSSTLRAREEASRILSQARANIKAEEDARHAKLEQNFAHQNKEAEKRVAALKEEALKQLLPVAAEIAVDITRSITGVNVPLEKAKEVASRGRVS